MVNKVEMFLKLFNEFFRIRKNSIAKQRTITGEISKIMNNQLENNCNDKYLGYTGLIVTNDLSSHFNDKQAWYFQMLNSCIQPKA